MRIFHKTTAILLTVCILLSISAIRAVGADRVVIDGGILKQSTAPDGDAVTWELTKETLSDGKEEYTLTIAGSGPMPDYRENPNTPSPTAQPPYYAYRNDVNRLEIEDGITAIGSGAFYGLKHLRSDDISFPGSLRSIGDGAFYGCFQKDGETAEGTLTLPGSLVSIGRNAFRDCTELGGSLAIPGSVKTIGDSAFRGCGGFTRLTLGSGVERLGDFAFASCTGLAGGLAIPGSVKTVGDHAFAFDENLNGALTIGNGVEEIGDYAFLYCARLTGSLTIPDSVKTVGQYAFAQFPMNVFDPDVNGDPVEVQGFNGSLTVGSGVTFIGGHAFCSLKNLTGRLTLNGSAANAEIGECAFHGCAAATDPVTFFTNYPKYITRSPAPQSGSDTRTFSIACADCDERIALKTLNIAYAYVTSISAADTVALNVGETRQLTAAAAPSNANNTKVRFRSADDSVATVTRNGLLTGVSAGTVTVTAFAVDGSGKTKEIAVTVSDIKVAGLTILEGDQTLEIGGKVFLHAIAAPENATDKAVRWSSSNDSVAAVTSYGQVTATGAGTAVITAAALDGSGKYTSVNITVPEKPRSAPASPGQPGDGNADGSGNTNGSGVSNGGLAEFFRSLLAKIAAFFAGLFRF